MLHRVSKPKLATGRIKEEISQLGITEDSPREAIIITVVICIRTFREPVRAQTTKEEIVIRTDTLRLQGLETTELVRVHNLKGKPFLLETILHLKETPVQTELRHREAQDLQEALRLVEALNLQEACLRVEVHNLQEALVQVEVVLEAEVLVLHLVEGPEEEVSVPLLEEEVVEVLLRVEEGLTVVPEEVEDKTRSHERLNQTYHALHTAPDGSNGKSAE